MIKESMGDQKPIAGKTSAGDQDSHMTRFRN